MNPMDFQSALGLFEQLTNDELRDIVTNDERFDEIIRDSSVNSIQKIESEKASLLAKNRALAEENLLLEPQLIEKREELKESHSTTEEQYKIVAERLQELNSKRDNIDAEKALELLQTASAETENESEEAAQKFLDKELEIDDFLEQFLTRRKLMHMRKVKVDKMKELISRRSLNYENVGGVTGGSYYPPINPSSVPYPTSTPMFMPLPGFNQNHYH